MVVERLPCIGTFPGYLRVVVFQGVGLDLDPPKLHSLIIHLDPDGRLLT